MSDTPPLPPNDKDITVIPGNWRPLQVDLRIDGKVRPVIILALFEDEPEKPTFTIVKE